MVSEDYLNNAIEQLSQLTNATNDKVLSIICNRIKKVGKLLPSDLQKVNYLLKSKDLAEIEKAIADYTKKGEKEIDKIITDVARENGIEITAQGLAQSETQNAIIQRASNLMKAEFFGLSNTTAFNLNGRPTSLSNTYNIVVDKAIYEVRSGAIDFNTAMAQTVQQLADSGLQKVDYANGYSRRLDSAVRMNILDGLTQMSMDIQKEIGESVGMDAFEITIVDNPAPDHAPLQGHIFDSVNFEKLQTMQDFEDVNGVNFTKIQRSIGEWNCRHIAFATYADSKPTHSKEELQEIIDRKNKEHNIKGVSGKPLHLSGYQAVQYQRSLELRIRKMNDRIKAFESAGNELEVNKCKGLLTQYRQQYKSICNELGLRTKLSRTK